MISGQKIFSTTRKNNWEYPVNILIPESWLTFKNSSLKKKPPTWLQSNFMTFGWVGLSPVIHEMPNNISLRLSHGQLGWQCSMLFCCLTFKLFTTTWKMKSTLICSRKKYLILKTRETCHKHSKILSKACFSKFPKGDFSHHNLCPIISYPTKSQSKSYKHLTPPNSTLKLKKLCIKKPKAVW